MTSWVPYDPNKSPVQASLAVAAVLETQGVKVIKMHQGAEESVPEKLEELRHFEGRLNPVYNNTIPLQILAAEYAQKFHGLPAKPENTFPLQVNGRHLLNEGWGIAATPYIESILEGNANKRPTALFPIDHWPMYQNVSKRTYIHKAQQIGYGLEPNNILNSVLKEIDIFTEGDQARHDSIAVFSSNLPANPTGYSSSVEEIKSIQNMLDGINADRSERGLPRIVHVADDPYFGGLEQKNTGSIFKTPYEGNFEVNGMTPSIHVISFSKALGTANPGMSIAIFTNDKMAKEFNAAVISDVGFSYVPGAMNNLGEMISPKNYGILRDHFNELRNKYVRNHSHVKNYLGPQLVAGDPNMVCALRIPPEVLNKSILCHDGERRVITNGRELAEYIANTHRVITVDQSRPDEPMLRLALKLKDSGQIEEGVKKIAQAFDDLRNAPALNRGAAVGAPDIGPH